MTESTFYKSHQRRLITEQLRRSPPFELIFTFYAVPNSYNQPCFVHRRQHIYNTPVLSSKTDHYTLFPPTLLVLVLLFQYDFIFCFHPCCAFTSFSSHLLIYFNFIINFFFHIYFSIKSSSFHTITSIYFSFS